MDTREDPGDLRSAEQVSASEPARRADTREDLEDLRSAEQVSKGELVGAQRRRKIWGKAGVPKDASSLG